MARRRNKKPKCKDEEISRRDFLKLSGAAVVGVGIVFPNMIWLDDAIAALPASEGYVLVDTEKCQGCLSCMLACSLVHEGVQSLSLARIQVLQDSFRKWPEDLTVEQCRQCVDPACVRVCPTRALHADVQFGNVRMVNPKKCKGCQLCIKACPYPPSKMSWDAEKRQALKCDLCANAPYHWDKAGGGPKGKLACVEVCSLDAIKFTKEIPAQDGEREYRVNLRGDEWRRLGYPPK